MKIAILGAGAFGTALGGILANNGYDIDYYDSKVEKERLSDVLASAKYIVLCVPSKVAPYLLPYIPKDIPLIVATKGILSDGVFADFKDWMVLSGPGFADDIKAKIKTRLTVTDDRLKTLFDAFHLELDETDDKKGILMCGALKNVYALMAGWLNLKPGTAEREKFIDEVVIEMKDILFINGAKPETVDCACGRGDLELTCYYPSRNYEFGVKSKLDADFRPDKTVEGISALAKIKRGEILVPESAKILKEIMEVYLWD